MCFARWILGCNSYSGVLGCLGGDVVRDGAQNYKFEGVCFLDASYKCWDVVKRDLSFKTRIKSSPNSSGRPRSLWTRYGF